VILVPVWFIIASAGSGENAVISSLTPEKWSLANFSALYDDPDNVQFNAWVKNTIIIGGVSSALNVLIGGFGAYAFSRLRFRGRRATLMTLLMIQVFPSFLALSAVYAIMLRITDYAPSIGLGTPWGLILIYTGGALGINAWLIKGFFDTLPKELDESAMIDGASHAQIFFRIILPLALPALAVVFMLSFIGSLNDFILASVILGTDPNNQTLAVGLYGFITSGFDSKWGPFAAGSVLASVPVVIIFMSLQKYIVSGLTAGSVKG
jgi:arabinogalactan oligomer/maltooligosaccharide transport system permease protein